MSGEELPEGWAVANLFELSQPKQWPTISTKELTLEGFPVYGANGQIGYFSEYNHEHPTILITCRGATCGNINVCAPKSYVTGNSMALDEVDDSLVDMSFLRFALQARGLSDTISGSAQPQITRTSLQIVELPLAPLCEQRRIVEKVEALLGQVNHMKGRLERVSAILKRFRQSVLAAACSGELTPELDSSRWQEVRLGDVIRGFEAGRNLKCHGRAARDGEFGVLKISAVTWGAFRANENKCLLEGDTPKPHEIVRAGDLLITRANTVELVGAVVLVDRDYHNLMLPDKILRLSLNHERIDSHYLLYALRTDTVRDHFEREATGTSDSMRNLSQPKLSSAPLILPPLEDQRKVAALVTRLFTLADTIERRVQTAMARVEKLPQAILSKAFSGELVPTEAELARLEGRTYETAEALLARVRNEAGTTNTARKPARKRRGAKKTGGD